MAKQKLYQRPEDVAIALASKMTSTQKLHKIKWSAKNKGDSDYAALIQEGIDKFNTKVQMQKAKEWNIVDEDTLREWEVREEVGCRG